MARVLAESMTWSLDQFEAAPEYTPDGARCACERVADLVSCSMALGVARREYSLASKVLHWLMPWQVPVYDSFVRVAVAFPASWDHPEAYRKVTAEVFAMADVVAGDAPWIGSFEPRSPLRALDKLAYFRAWETSSATISACLASSVRRPRTNCLAIAHVRSTPACEMVRGGRLRYL